MISKDRPILLIGCGNMGKALVTGWCESYITPSHIHALVSSEKTAQALTQDIGIHAYGALEIIPDITPSIIIIAVKPDQIASVVPDIFSRWSDTSIPYASLAAGKPLSFYETMIGKNHSIIRIMPNIACRIQQSMSVCIENLACRFEHKELVHQLMSAVGKVAWLDNETQMHAATALAGSGPAFVYYFAECLIEAGLKHGLSPKLSQNIVRHMLAGTTALSEYSEEGFSQLRDSITSKGGTTEAGLTISKTLGNHEFSTMVDAMIDASVSRSKEFST